MLQQFNACGIVRSYRIVKRSFDIVFSATVLVCLYWLFVIISVTIKIDNPAGLVFFKQRRVGKDGRGFYMYKFRSMCADVEAKLESPRKFNEKTGPVFKIADNPRMTRVGRFIRKTSLTSAIMGALGAGKLINSLLSAAKTSLDRQFYEQLPEVVSCDVIHYTSPEFLSFDVFRGSQKAQCETVNQPDSDGQTNPRCHATGFISFPLNDTRYPVSALGVAA